MQGIITGIGNEITPEIDAVINDFIVGKNTILKGLELNGNILSAGTCILCGYRGTLENSQTVDGNYVYGKFVIGVNETDSFSIITSSNSTEPTDGIINPTSITSAGTYYLRLYANGTIQVDSERYPNQANTSDRARDLIAGGTIDSTATTDTAPANNNSQRVANTEYVHNQIVVELDEKTSSTIKLTLSNGVSTQKGSLIVTRRAKFCIATLTMPSINIFKDTTDIGNMEKGYYPKEILQTSISSDNTLKGIATFQISTTGQISVVNIGGTSLSPVGLWGGTYKIGYECQ